MGILSTLRAGSSKGCRQYSHEYADTDVAEEARRTRQVKEESVGHQQEPTIESVFLTMWGANTNARICGREAKTTRIPARITELGLSERCGEPSHQSDRARSVTSS